jgi:acetolactate decarboxylase
MGQVWQVPDGGHPARAVDTARAPFAVVTRFAPHPKIAVPAGLEMAALGAFLDKQVADLGLIQAVRIDGRFRQLRVRSVRAQTPPYQPLSEVLARDQVVFDLVNTQGTLVGFRFPAYFSGVNAPGFLRRTGAPAAMCLGSSPARGKQWWILSRTSRSNFCHTDRT